MNLWKQSKQFVCPRCGESYIHDRAYKHSLFSCPKRQRAGAPMTKHDPVGRAST